MKEIIVILKLINYKFQVKVQPDISKVKSESSKNKKHKHEKKPDEKFDLRNKIVKKYTSKICFEIK